MRSHESLLFRIAWISLVVTGTGVLVFGLFAVLRPIGVDRALFRSFGFASIGMGLFGIAVTLDSYRRCRPWAWFTLWYFPLFWIMHRVLHLPPSYDHVHQDLFIGLSLAGLLLPVRDFFPPRRAV